jgi:beta-glucanase (GH16 family)
VRASRWKLALGAVIVLAIGLWDVGLPGSSHSPSSAANAPSPNASPQPTSSPSTHAPDALAGVLTPQGDPEFSATFTGTQLDTAVWATCYPSMDVPTGCTNFGNKFHEREWFLPSQVQVSGGALHFVAQRKPTLGQTATGRPEEYACRSGMVTTYPSFRFMYGYVKIVARIPNDGWLWPALWLAPADLQTDPEIDILEAYGRGPFSATATLHYGTPKKDTILRQIPATAIEVGWHTYVLSWTKAQLTVLVDGKVMLTTRVHVPHKKMYLILDLAQYVLPSDPVVQAGWCNGTMDVRSVRIWKT